MILIGTIEHQTERAYLISFGDGEKKEWLPKSQVSVDHNVPNLPKPNVYIEAPDWLIENKELEGYVVEE